MSKASARAGTLTALQWLGVSRAHGRASPNAEAVAILGHDLEMTETEWDAMLDGFQRGRTVQANLSDPAVLAQGIPSDVVEFARWWSGVKDASSPAPGETLTGSTQGQETRA